MKLQIIKNDDDSIEGFISIKVSENPETELSKIISNSCTEMLVLDIIDYFDYDKSISFLADLLSKIRLNGSILLRGISSVAFSHALFNGSLDCKKASDIIANIKSVHDQRDIIGYLEANNFSIDTVRLMGASYEIKATRHTNVS